jgi:C1A family cysteine protease
VNRHLGTGRDRVSPLDWKYRPHSSVVRRLPAVVDLRRHCPPVYDQLHLNSCSANAIAAAVRYDELREGHPDVASPSRLFIYYNERVLAGVVDADTPVALRDGYRAVSKGDGGYGYLPYAFLASANLTWDFWTMRRVS